MALSSFPKIDNVISTVNSRAASTLAAAAVFQGTSEDVTDYNLASISVKSDNATDGVLTMETSLDGTTWSGPTRDWADTSAAQPHMWKIAEKYFRIKYTNGTTEATNLSIQCKFSVSSDVFLAHQLDETLSDETEAIVVRAVFVGEDSTDGVYRNASVDNLNHLDVVAHAHAEGGHVLFKKDFSATEDVILIDLSDTTNYPHSHTSWLHTGNVRLEVDATNTADYVIQLGFLENVDGTDGDFHEIFEVDGSKQAGNDHSILVSSAPEAPQLRSTRFVGPVTLNDTAFNTGTNLRSTLDPTGTAATPSGSGDMVMRVTRTAGSFVVSLLVGYHSHG